MMTSTMLKTSVLSLGLAALLGACPSAGNKSGVQPIGDPKAVEPGDTSGNEVSPVVFPQEEFRKTQPVPTEPRAFNLPGITRFKLGNQIDVFLAERHELPTISLELNFDGGTVSDRTGREGTASLCMSMVSEGTKKLEKLAFEEAKANIASGISSYAGAESQGISMRTLSKNFDATFGLFADTLLEPGFRDAELERMVKRSLESLKQSKGSAGSVARRVSGNIAYGERHPFGKIVTEKSLRKIKIGDCKSYHKSYVKPKGARLFVVGDMTQAQITEAFTPLLAKWKGAPKKLAKVPAPKSRKGRVFFIDIPGAAQSTISVGHMGPGRKDPSFFANQMMVGVLGGGFSSRINMNLREDKGYSYGARGSFSYNRHFGTFRASSSVRSDSTHQSLLELLTEVTLLQSGTSPAKVEELTREQNGAILGLPARFATAGQVLSMYRNLVYYDLPTTYYNDYVANFKAVTLEQVNAAATKLLHPEDSIILVVGDASVPQIFRNEENKDVPRMKADGKTQMTLLDTITELAASEKGGKGKLVILDADGNIKK
ncbi:MAG: insulinase family protein [Myxococcales bacterium]|nr:insulinase family protein [Myxococcales bacterium]